MAISLLRTGRNASSTTCVINVSGGSGVRLLFVTRDASAASALTATNGVTLLATDAGAQRRTTVWSVPSGVVTTTITAPSAAVWAYGVVDLGGATISSAAATYSSDSTSPAVAAGPLTVPASGGTAITWWSTNVASTWTPASGWTTLDVVTTQNAEPSWYLAYAPVGTGSFTSPTPSRGTATAKVESTGMVIVVPAVKKHSVWGNTLPAGTPTATSDTAGHTGNVFYWHGPAATITGARILAPASGLPTGNTIIRVFTNPGNLPNNGSALTGLGTLVAQQTFNVTAWTPSSWNEFTFTTPAAIPANGGLIAVTVEFSNNLYYILNLNARADSNPTKATDGSPLFWCSQPTRLGVAQAVWAEPGTSSFGYSGSGTTSYSTDVIISETDNTPPAQVWTGSAWKPSQLWNGSRYAPAQIHNGTRWCSTIWPDPPRSTKDIAVYKMMWSTEGPTISSINAGVNQIRLAFAQGSGQPALVGYGLQGKASTIADLAAFRKRGGKVIISAGGQGGVIDSANSSALIAAYSAIKADLGGNVDGWDWDVEASTLDATGALATSQGIKALGGLITFTPNGANVSTYLSIAASCQSAGCLDSFGQQFYDAPVTVDDATYRIQQAMDAGIPANKYAVGMMIGSTANYWTNAVAKSNMQTLRARFPGLQKVYLWEAQRAGTDQWVADMNEVLG